MKTQKNIKYIFLMYAFTVVINQFWRFGSGEIYLPGIKEYYPADWFIYICSKYLINMLFVGMIYIESKRKIIKQLSILMILIQASNILLFYLFQYKRDTAIEIMIFSVYFGGMAWLYFNHHQEE